MNQATRLKPLFHPGRPLVTPAAMAALRTNGVPVVCVMLRHISGDWGCISEDDKRENDLSINAGLRLLSLYRLPDQTRILVITEWDRSHTTIERFDEVVVTGRHAEPAQRQCYPSWPVIDYVREARA